jgi:hypothetical protein
VTFSGGVQVSPGSIYYVVLTSPAMTLSDYYYLPLNNTNPYADGEWYKGVSAYKQVTHDMLLKLVFGS